MNAKDAKNNQTDQKNKENDGDINTCKNNDEKRSCHSKRNSNKIKKKNDKAAGKTIKVVQ